MALEVYLPPVEMPDGERVFFTAATPAYLPGSLQVYFNEGLTDSDGATWIEVAPNRVQFLTAPTIFDGLILEFVPS